MIPQLAVPAPDFSAPVPGLAAPAPPQTRQPATPALLPTSSTDALPATELLPVIGGLIALGLAGAGSGAISFRSAAAEQARIDAARAQFFPRP